MELNENLEQAHQEKIAEAAAKQSENMKQALQDRIAEAAAEPAAIKGLPTSEQQRYANQAIKGLPTSEPTAIRGLPE